MTNIKTKKVAFFIPSFRGGGAEKVIVDIANELRRRSYCVELVVLSAKGPNLSLIDTKIRLITLGTPSMRRSIIALAKYLRAEKPHSIMSTGLHTNLTLIFASMLAMSKSILVAREALPIDREMKQGKLHAVLTRLFYSHFDVFISLTQCQQKIRRNIIKTNRDVEDFVIPNPLDVKKLKTLSAQKNANPSLGNLQSGEKYIVSCGRLTEQKNYSCLIEAFSQVREKINCKLVILGEGELRKTLEKQIEQLNLKSYVILQGYVDNPHPIVAQASVYVQSSIYEGMPNSLLHAFAMGVQCVATDCQCGPSEIFSYASHGRLVKVNDVADLKGALIEALEKPSAVTDTSGITRDYSLARVCDLYESALKLDVKELSQVSP